jgi:hypothetical protein
VLAIAKAASVLHPHHGSGMPKDGRSGHNHLLDALLGQIARSSWSKGAGKGGGQGKLNKYPPSWNCTCGYYNFEGRYTCRVCNSKYTSSSGSNQPQPKPKPDAGGKAQGRQQAAAAKNTKGDKAAKVTDTNVETMDEGDDQVDNADIDPAVKADVAKLTELSKLLEDTVKAVGREDPTATALRARVDAARAAQWSGKPISLQL